MNTNIELISRKRFFVRLAGFASMIIGAPILSVHDAPYVISSGNVGIGLPCCPGEKLEIYPPCEYMDIWDDISKTWIVKWNIQCNALRSLRPTNVLRIQL